MQCLNKIGGINQQLLHGVPMALRSHFFSHDHVLHFRGYHLLIHNLSAETMLSFCIVTFSFPVSFQHTFMLFLVVQRALLQLGQQIASKAERIEREEANEYIFVGSFVQD